MTSYLRQLLFICEIYCLYVKFIVHMWRELLQLQTWVLTCRKGVLMRNHDGFCYEWTQTFAMVAVYYFYLRLKPLSNGSFFRLFVGSLKFLMFMWTCGYKSVMLQCQSLFSRIIVDDFKSNEFLRSMLAFGNLSCFLVISLIEMLASEIDTS